MKIGILTYHAPCNFGANLQAYSSARFFDDLGYEVKVINYLRSGDINPTYCSEKQRIAHSSFCQNRLPLTKTVTSDNILDVVSEERFDVIAIGADAVWNKGCRKDLELFYAKWLWGTDMASKVKVICLSPAFMGQTYSDLSKDEKESFKNSLEQFWRVNARDAWTRDAINKEIMHYEYIKTLNPDPVFLLNQYCTDEWMHESSIISKNYLLISLPANFFKSGNFIVRKWKTLWSRYFKRYVNNKGLKLVELPIPEGESGIKCDYTVPYPIDPLQWYLWIKNSRGFIGLRFHAVVSCLSSGTPFFSLDVYGASSSRIISILNLLGIHFNDSKYNTKSKIRNLLQGSGLEKYRVNGTNIFLMSPRKLYRLINTFDKQKAVLFVNEQVDRFTYNMKEALR